MISFEKIIVFLLMLFSSFQCQTDIENCIKVFSIDHPSVVDSKDNFSKSGTSISEFSHKKVTESIVLTGTENLLLRKRKTFNKSTRYRREHMNVEELKIDESDEENSVAYPYMVVVRWDDRIVICLGSVISHWHVLTAAHCVVRTNTGEQREANRLTIRVGSNYRTEGLKYEIKRWFVPFNYVRKDKVNDVAVLELTKYLEFSDRINLLPLVSTEDQPSLAQLVEERETCFIVGWPRISNKIDKTRTVQNDVLHIYDSDKDFAESFIIEPVNILKLDECKKMASLNHLSLNTDTEVCSTFLTLKRPCNAIIGGPLICQFKQYGIITKEKGCNQNSAITMYSRTDTFFDFITDSMKRRDVDLLRNEELTKMSKQSSLRPLNIVYIFLALVKILCNTYL